MILMIVVWKSNAKVSDGSQPPASSASPLGVPAGARSLDRLVRVSDSWATGNAAQRCRPVASHLGMARALNWSCGEP